MQEDLQFSSQNLLHDKIGNISLDVGCIFSTAWKSKFRLFLVEYAASKKYLLDLSTILSTEQKLSSELFLNSDKIFVEVVIECEECVSQTPRGIFENISF